jgi:hypothetical protein
MQITHVTIKGVEYKLKTPIVMQYTKSNQQHILYNDALHLMASSDDMDLCEAGVRAEFAMIVDDYLNEPNYLLSKDAIELRNMLKRVIYGE